MDTDEETEAADQPAMSQAVVVGIGVGTLVGFGGVGWFLIDVVQQRSLLAMLMGPASFPVQLGVGAVAGGAIGAISMGISRFRFMEPALEPFRSIGQSIRAIWLIVFLSLCAGVGEEIFFRGALQVWLGIPLTAVVFVLIHGYLNPWNWRISVYGLFMTAAMIGIGFMSDQIGLTSAITAHAVVDIIALRALSRRWPADQRTSA